jgi:ribosomal protein L7/L12
MTSLGLRGSKEIADNVPSPVVTGVKHQFALKSKDILEKAGGTAEIRPTEND